MTTSIQRFGALRRRFRKARVFSEYILQSAWLIVQSLRLTVRISSVNGSRLTGTWTTFDSEVISAAKLPVRELLSRHPWLENHPLLLVVIDQKMAMEHWARKAGGYSGDSPADRPGYRFGRMMRFQVFGSILMGAQTPLVKLTNPPWYETVPYRNNRPSKASACCARVWFTNGSCFSNASAALQLG
jgi:hypothetical protein